MTIPQRDLVTSLHSCVCPACGGPKRQRHTFCGRDYFRLPEAMRLQLYHRVGSRYEQLVGAAMDKLGASTFRLSAAVPKPVTCATTQSDAQPCPECGAQVHPRRRHCRACGFDLGTCHVGVDQGKLFDAGPTYGIPD
ncbi:MAG TPA: hypothetical protein VF624_15810 [Tepidisphaeraceae bacterium]